MARTPTEKLIDRTKLSKVAGIIDEVFDAEILKLRKLYGYPPLVLADFKGDVSKYLRAESELTSAQHKQLAHCVAMCRAMAAVEEKPVDATDRYADLMAAVKEAFDQKQLEEIDADLKRMGGADV